MQLWQPQLGLRGVCVSGICDRRDIQGWRASLVGRDLVVGAFSVWLTHTKDGAE